MRILAVFSLYLPWGRGGGEVMAHEVLKGLASRGHEIEVLVGQGLRDDFEFGHEEEVVDGIRARTMPLDEVYATARSFAPDLVFGQGAATLTSADVAASVKAPFVDIVHDSSWRSLHNTAATKPALSICNTLFVADVLYSHAVRTTVMRPPITPDNHATDPGDRVTLINLIPPKGSEFFYKLVELLPDVPFLGVKGGYGIQDARYDLPNLEIRERTNDMVRDVWSKTSVLLVPSRYESYSMVSLEAAASGIPVFAVPTGGIREAMGTAATYRGLTDVEGWVEQIRRTRTDREWYRDLSARAKDRSQYVYELTKNDLGAALDEIEALLLM